MESVEKKRETKNPPLLYNLAELQNDCSRFFKISPDDTLKVVQELYEKKMVTYPRTDARVLSTAVAREIHRNIGGLKGFPPAAGFAAEILERRLLQGDCKDPLCERQTDHRPLRHRAHRAGAFGDPGRLASSPLSIYEVIGRRFLSNFLSGGGVPESFTLDISQQGRTFLFQLPRAGRGTGLF